MARPFLKWAGGKRQLLPRLLDGLPPVAGKYIEPFVGGGALFFALEPRIAVIADVNRELVETYRAVKSEPCKVIEGLDGMENSEEEYYRIRALEPRELDGQVGVACRMIYLNHLSFNGQYRVNKKGKFNASYCKDPLKNWRPAKEDVMGASSALQQAAILHGEYSYVLKCAAEGDLVYLDPPYLPTSENEMFARYDRHRFNAEDHEVLWECAKQLYCKKGCNVMISNSCCEKALQLYDGHDIEIVDAKNSINCKGNGRKRKEIIVRMFR